MDTKDQICPEMIIVKKTSAVGMSEMLPRLDPLSIRNRDRMTFRSEYMGVPYIDPNMAPPEYLRKRLNDRMVKADEYRPWDNHGADI